MSKPFPALCRDCKFSKPEDDSRPWALRCANPVVNAKDPWMLGSTSNGTECRGERERKWLAACGMKGKLWMPKETPDER